jgi:hypothetical protein
MRKRKDLLGPLAMASLIPALLPGQANAQNEIENVIVETYYISNATDAVETEEGGILPEGSKTYRVYLDLSPDCSLRAIYGSQAHPLEIISTALFYNNMDRGKSFGHQVNTNWLDENTVPVDSWLSFGAATSTRFGILKSEDTDGSDFIQGNDMGMMMNSDAQAGIPIVDVDGLVEDTSQSTTPPTLFISGISPDSTFLDTTQAATFITDSTVISCTSPGMRGPTAENKILIAQLTTTGELTFHLNVEIECGGEVLRFVALDTLLADDETPNGFLSYPPVCGCTDPNFLEYDPSAGCDDGSCQTEIVFGCLDPNACNYDPDANFNLDALCCYGPDSCNGLDVNILCPGVGVDELSNAIGLTVFPNPVRETLHLHIERAGATTLFLLDRSGRLVREQMLNATGGSQNATIDVSDLSRGIYLLRALNDKGDHWSQIIVKQ